MRFDGQRDGQLRTETTIASRPRPRRIRVVRPCRASASAPRRAAARGATSRTRPRRARSGGKAERQCVHSKVSMRRALASARVDSNDTRHPQTYDEGSEQGAAVRDVSIKFVSANRYAASREFARDFPVWGVPYRHVGDGLRALGGARSGAHFVRRRERTVADVPRGRRWF